MNPTPESKTDGAGTAAQLRVLLVDDVTMNRRVAELILKHLGCTAVSAEDVHDALRQIRAVEFDFVFTDVEMPDINGIEAIALFHEADRGGHPGRARPLKIVAISAGRIGMTHKDYLAAGFDEHLAKPLEVEQMRAVLHKWDAPAASPPVAPPAAAPVPVAKTASSRITTPLQITEQQLAQLDLHSFLNILNILMGDLQLLTIDLKNPVALAETTHLGKELLELVRAGRLNEEASAKAASLHAAFLKEWSDVLRLTPEAANAKPDRETAANLDSILKVMTVRLKEYQERVRTGVLWKPHSIQLLTDNFVNFLAALEKNSKGRYHIIFNIASQDPADYLVNFRIESVDGDMINMPPVLQDVFRDLIANARKYTPPGGCITAGLHDNGKELRMAVEDTGCGIPPEEVERVVEFGYRATNVREKVTKGGGFGLTKAYYLTTKLGGTMWISSTLGKGTRVTVHIPRPAR